MRLVNDDRACAQLEDAVRPRLCHVEVQEVPAASLRHVFDAVTSRPARHTISLGSLIAPVAVSSAAHVERVNFGAMTTHGRDGETVCAETIALRVLPKPGWSPSSPLPCEVKNLIAECW